MYDIHLGFTVLLFLFVTFIYTRSNVASIFHPATYYIFFHGLVFVLRPIFQYYGDYETIYTLYLFFPSDTVKNTTLLIANLGFISFIIPALHFGRRPIRFDPASALPTSARERPGGQQLLLALAICAPLIAISFYYALQRNYNSDAPVSMMQDAMTNRAIFTDNSGYLVDANMMLVSLSALVAWVYRFRLISLIPLSIFILLRAYIGGGRWTFVMATATLGLLYLYDKRARWFNLRLVLVGALVLVIFSAVGNSRVLVAEWASGQEVQSKNESNTKGYFDNMDFANLEYLEYIVSVVPDRTGTYDYFLKNLELLTAPIPRILWPEKPLGPPIQLYNIVDYGFPIGITWTLPGEGWQDFGYLGVVVWCFFGGWLWGKMYNWFVTSNQTRTLIACYCVLLPLSVQWFRDGILLTLVKFPFFPLLPVLLWHGICELWPPDRGQPAFPVRAVSLQK